MRRVNATGNIYGNLTAIEFAFTKNSKSYWKCMCTCGNNIVVALNNLSSGLTRSCGCLRTHKFNPGEAGLRKIYLNYKKSAKKENREFELTLEEFKEITSNNCSYCGGAPSTISATKRSNKPEIIEYTSYRYNGIDRIDSSKGYVRGNVTSSCRWCNIAKSNRTVEEFKEHFFKMYNHLNKIGIPHEPALPKTPRSSN